MKNTTRARKSMKMRMACRFVKAMKRVSRSASMADRQHAVRAAAYGSMAAAIGPRKAWSRAILGKMRMIKPRRRGGNPRMNGGDDQLGIADELKDLSEVVPGGKAMDSYNLLNETHHYIKCLTAQVQIMRTILQYSTSI